MKKIILFILIITNSFIQSKEQYRYSIICPIDMEQELIEAAAHLKSGEKIVLQYKETFPFENDHQKIQVLKDLAEELDLKIEMIHHTRCIEKDSLQLYKLITAIFLKS
jgi:hypothetical protein